MRHESKFINYSRGYYVFISCNWIIYLGTFVRQYVLRMFFARKTKEVNDYLFSVTCKLLSFTARLYFAICRYGLNIYYSPITKYMSYFLPFFIKKQIAAMTIIAKNSDGYSVMPTFMNEYPNISTSISVIISTLILSYHSIPYALSTFLYIV